FSRTHLRKWRNWQTHQLEGLALARAWGVESPLPHLTLAPLQPKHSLRILAQQLALDLPIGFEAAAGPHDLCAQTGRSAPGPGAAVAAEEQLLAVPRQEIARELLVPRQRVES